MNHNKKIIITIVIIVSLILLIPFPIRLKDGGSIKFRSMLYNVTKYKQLDIDAIGGYITGWKIEILGIKIYDKKTNNTQAQYLFNLKNKYIGNASANTLLLEALEVSKLAKYKIELKTSEEPYILYINFDNIDPTNITDNTISNFKNKMKINSVILLALIENADEIHYNDLYCNRDDNIVNLKASDLEEELGNIKDYGKTIDKFQELLVKIEYNK